MGLSNTLSNLAEKVVAENLVAAVEWLLEKAMGDKADDSDKAAVLRAAVEAATAATQARIANKVAADALPAKLRDLAQSTKRILDAFEVHGAPAIDFPVELTVDISQVSWDLLVGGVKRDGLEVTPPTDAERVSLLAVGRVLGRLYVISDFDRRVPADAQKIIDREWEASGMETVLDEPNGAT